MFVHAVSQCSSRCDSMGLLNVLKASSQFQRGSHLAQTYPQQILPGCMFRRQDNLPSTFPLWAFLKCGPYFLSAFTAHRYHNYH